MSENSVAFNNGQQMVVNTDLSTIFLWRNNYRKYTYNNSAYDSVTLSAGTLMGTVAATGWVKPLASGAADGSQFPTGILAQDYVVEGGDSVEVFVCIDGDVAEDKVILSGSDTLDTTISSRRIRDRIGSDTVGINLVPSTENTSYDNQL